MHYRRLEVDDAHPNTCSWITDHKSYTSWISDDRGMLWIKGKPGAGKSTLMAFLYKILKANSISQDDWILEFFFHRRGVDLQRTIQGMLRSLLCQVFIKSLLVRRSVLGLFGEKSSFGEAGEAWKWQVNELKHLLSNALLQIESSQNCTVFVDALDEAGQEGARDVLAYFYYLHYQINKSKRPVRICISSRHYRVLSVVTPAVPTLEINVEECNKDDISTYVRSVLSSGAQAEQDWMSLEDEIIESALGVFQWARLVTPGVAEWRNDGESLENIRKMIAKIPSELEGVYQHILKDVISNRHRHNSLLMMQWICLAQRPLSLTQLRFAMAADVCVQAKPSSCKETKGFIDTDSRMEKLVTSWSGSLAEVNHYMSSQQQPSSTVQLIHQSVDDYLISGGLAF